MPLLLWVIVMSNLKSAKYQQLVEHHFVVAVSWPNMKTVEEEGRTMYNPSKH